MDLKSLNKSIDRALAEKKPKPLPRIDDTPERIVVAIEEAHAKQSKDVMDVLKKIADKDFTVEVDAAEIGAAVGKEIRKIPAPKLEIPERKPLSYKASFERNSRGDMISARLDPILE